MGNRHNPQNVSLTTRLRNARVDSNKSQENDKCWRKRKEPNRREHMQTDSQRKHNAIAQTKVQEQLSQMTRWNNGEISKHIRSTGAFIIH